jgi:hypothetical protein
MAQFGRGRCLGLGPMKEGPCALAVARGGCDGECGDQVAEFLVSKRKGNAMENGMVAERSAIRSPGCTRVDKIEPFGATRRPEAGY